MPTLIHQRVKAASENNNPTVIYKMSSGWAVLGDNQFIHGYSLLLPDPVVKDLNQLTSSQRTNFLNDMTLIGDALLVHTDAYRINYEILGNSEPALHAHIFPRYMSEPEEFRSKPVWMYPKEERNSRPFCPNRDAELMNQIASFIREKLTISN